MKPIFACFLLCLAFLVAIPAMADITIGNPPDPGTGNCFPFGCSYNAEYQQVYGASDFNGPITITNLEFFNTQVDFGSTELPLGTYQIRLSTTSVGVNTIGSSFSANEGADITTVFNGSINQAWAFGDTLHITLSTPFTYNPANGNLLMDVIGTNSNAAFGNTYFDVNSTGGYFSRVYCSGGVDCGDSGVVNVGYGLVTGFSTGTTTPEPSTLLMLGSGLLGVIGVVRRRIL